MRTLALVLAFAALAGAVVTGWHLGRHGIALASQRVEALERERNELNAELAELGQRAAALERAQLADQETARALREQLKDAQAQRFGLEKELALLRRLIQEGGGGVLQLKDVSVEPVGADGLAYRFTLLQLVPDFGWSEGVVDLSVGGRLGGQEKVLGARELDGSEPLQHSMRLQHFQAFDGRLRLPQGFVPERLMIEVRPKTKALLPLSETFTWPSGP